MGSNEELAKSLPGQTAQRKMSSSAPVLDRIPKSLNRSDAQRTSDVQNLVQWTPTMASGHRIARRRRGR